jgi:hypothetical protein
VSKALTGCYRWLPAKIDPDPCQPIPVGRYHRCGLIEFRAEGRQSFYALARPELLELLRSAEQVLAATGDAVALCPVYGQPATDPATAVTALAC